MGYHVPVLLRESVEMLDIKPDGVYVDLTLGGGGHSKAILERLGESGRLFCFDRDGDALQNAPEDSRVRVVRSNFRDLSRWLDYWGASAVDGVLADLGVSSHHLDSAHRGFSYSVDGPLDMRMGHASSYDAYAVVNQVEEKRLADILFTYGELRDSRRIARQIVEARREKALETTGELRRLLERPGVREEENRRLLSCVFQAIRIEVNSELSSLETVLESLPSVVKSGGRVVFISYHSLEDKLVKRFLRYGALREQVDIDLYGRAQAPFRMLSRGVIGPSEEEVCVNSRSRSARMRVGERN